ncbi:hypothetical protein ABOM_012012 [Aspergillus bombycis]|uniref:GPI anchored protein n=1 Tax=Aspergillus bombycis TaxID=109264 RepID=A0A1F7ZJ24_9EURO|nr:hypothetical protein ABOM_012012 [Aspergillus bombycis]OGM39309.1 hypothetical protein ABOM_012012 [Aspergillus bombycis]
MARTTLSFYTVCFILALTGSALPAKRADPSSPSSAVAPNGMANIAYDAVKVSYTLKTPDGTVIDRTQSTTHMAQDINKEFYDDDETPKPTPVGIHPVPTPSSSGTATKSLKDLYKAQSAERVHDLEEPSSSPSPEPKTDTKPEEPQEEEETPTEDQKQSEPTPTPTPTPTKKSGSSASAAPAASSPPTQKDNPTNDIPVIGPLLGAFGGIL